MRTDSADSEGGRTGLFLRLEQRVKTNSKSLKSKIGGKRGPRTEEGARLSKESYLIKKRVVSVKKLPSRLCEEAAGL